MPKLILLQGGEVIPYNVTEEKTVIGRHPDCTIKLDSNMLSRRHASLNDLGASGYAIEDLGSGNGTFVNGKKIEGLTPLKHDDRIKLGPILFRFESDDGEPTSQVESFGKTEAFSIDIMGDEREAPTIMGAISNSSGFGSLDVQPEAKLSAVLEISRALAGSVDVTNLLPKILSSMFTIFPHADRGCILLKDEKSDKMVPRAIKHRRESDDDTVKLSKTILNSVLEKRSGILSADASSDSRFQGSESISNLTIRSMMCVPMLGIDGEPLGIINIDTQNPLKQFKKDDLEILTAVASQAALSYETTRLIASYAEKQKQDSEMNIAKEVQKALLPLHLPQVPGYEFFASYESAQAVGGDYYDVFEMPDGRICVAFGDVAGKGVPASLVMARLSSVVRSTLDTINDISRAMALINNHMCNRAVEGRFVTMIMAVIDLKTNQMTAVNAGHMSPLFKSSSGDVTEFPDDSVGIPIGVMEDYPYELVEHTLADGELFVIYTDGVSEAMNHQSELYGMDRLRNLVKNGQGTPEELGKIIREDVRKHANGRPQNDDITMMVVGRK
jgi:serine phosphatase RsbU (regulator of sigma subunit)